MKELRPLALLLASIVLTGILIPTGIIHNIVKSLIECFKGNFWASICKFIFYWLKILYQIWNAIKFILMKLAVCLDLIWNATSGEMIEDGVTAEENTLYGMGNVTVSAATGELEFKDKLNKTGKAFNRLLSFTLGKNHSIDAYKKELLVNQ